MNSLKISSKLSKISVISLAVATLIGINVATAADGFANSNVNNFNSSITHQDIVSLTNQDRLGKGVAPLQENLDLDSAAMAKAQDMLVDNYFDHYSPTGETPWDFILANGYNYHFAGENLAMDFNTSNGVNSAWLNSPKHAKNIYNPNYTNIGVAVVEGELEGHQTTLVVQMFGTPEHSMVDDFNFAIIQTVSNLLGIGK